MTYRAARVTLSVKCDSIILKAAAKFLITWSTTFVRLIPVVNSKSFYFLIKGELTKPTHEGNKAYFV